MDIDADLNLQGQFESPRLDGRVTVHARRTRGRRHSRPHPVSALLHRRRRGPGSARCHRRAQSLGSPGHRHRAARPGHAAHGRREHPGVAGHAARPRRHQPARALGDLYLYKDPAQPLYVTGSLDSVTGTYAFQGRRFDLDRLELDQLPRRLQPGALRDRGAGDLGVCRRGSRIAGPLVQPELRLSSTPPLDPSDILR